MPAVKNSNLKSLHQLHSGERACVDSLEGRPEVVRRLKELGLRRGAVLEMLHPGSPCVILLNGSKLCFRRCRNSNVLVTTAEETQ